jgi:hypothetical protein
MTIEFNPIALSPELEHFAQRRVKARMGWFTHAFIYVCVISGLSVLALLRGHALPLGTAMGWGFGLLMHGLAVFFTGTTNQWRASLQTDMLQRERARLMASNSRQSQKR